MPTDNPSPTGSPSPAASPAPVNGHRPFTVVLIDAVAVFAFGLSAIGQAISMAVLIFSGPLEEALPRATASFVIAGGILGVYVGLRSRIVPAGTVVQDGPAIVMVAVAAAVGAGTPAGASDVFALLVITTFSTAVLMWLVGRLGLGGLVRYMPTTVVGAFMAGTGWLLVKGGLDVMVGLGVGLEDLDDLFGGDLIRFWVPGMALGLLLWMVGGSRRMPVGAVGATIVVTLILFYVIVWLFSSIEAVESTGWLIGPFPDGAGLTIISPAELADADWGRIAGSLPGIVSVVAVTIIVLLLNLTSLGSQRSGRLDVDAELRTAAVANLLTSPLGVSPGFHGLADTVLLDRMGARQRLVPVTAGVLMVAFGAVGVGLVGYVPRLVVGALLVTIGSALLEGWVISLFRSVHRVEQILSIGIVAVIASIGILEGIGVGLVAACAVFIVRYSRIDPVRAIGTGMTMRSRVDRSAEGEATLSAKAERLVVYELQGYLFFGSLASLKDRFTDMTGVDAVVLDFRNVTGIDTSGYSLIGQVAHQLSEAGRFVVLCSLDDNLQRSLLASVPAMDQKVSWAPSLDHGLEAAEDAQLVLWGQSADHRDRDIPEPRRLSDELLAVFDEVSYEAGTVIMEQGADSDGMLVVGHGVMTAYRIAEDGSRLRLRRFGASAVVGEMGLITGAGRSVEITAETDVVAKWLSLAEYHRLRQDHPNLVLELYEFILHEQSTRVATLSQGLAQSTR